MDFSAIQAEPKALMCLEILIGPIHRNQLLSARGATIMLGQSRSLLPARSPLPFKFLRQPWALQTMLLARAPKPVW